ncbi:hypothetical protein BJ138DRAFT_1112104 [Hygrophoropsis aurantiaca]|uniref:Uncharacterized protein n=1 Tax=Hygrophoropsis aurantiaca TaxID=72124 RepID=A0ACB8AGP4_9AGAM|nr:hypothetical protein BJ138DRAFT_1112104 [Hygrophoropsis aurantiaca]
MPKFTDASQREFHSRHQRGVDALPYPLTPAPNHDPVPTNRHREPIYQTEAGRVWRWMHDDPTTASPPPPGLGTGFPPNIYAAAGFDSHLNPQANDYNDFYRQRPYHHAPEFPTAGISSSSRLDPRYGYPPECTPSSYGSFTRHLAEEEPVTTPVIPFNLFPEVNRESSNPLVTPIPRHPLPAFLFMQGEERGTPFDTSADVQSTPPEEIFTAQTDPNARIRSNPPPGHWDPIIQDDSDSSTYSILLAPVPDIPGHTEHIHVSEVHVFCEVLCDSPSTIRTEDLFRAEQLKQAEPQHRPGYQPPSRDQPHPSAHAGPDQGPSPNVAINIIPPTNSSDSRSTPKSSLGSKKQSDESGDIKIAEPLSPKVSNRPGTPRPNEQLATTRTPPRLNPSNLASGYLSSPFSKVRLRLKKDAQYVRALARIPEGRVSKFRSDFKAAAERRVPAALGLVKNAAGREKAASLLHQDTYLFPLDSKGNPIRNKPFQSPAILYTIETASFGNPTCAGIKYHNLFTSTRDDCPDEVELPPAMVALAATAVHAVIMDYMSESMEITDFHGVVFGGIYSKLVNRINAVFATSEKKYHSMMATLYKLTYYGSKYGRDNASNVQASAIDFDVDGMAED